MRPFLIATGVNGAPDASLRQRRAAPVAISHSAAAPGSGGTGSSARLPIPGCRA